VRLVALVPAGEALSQECVLFQTAGFVRRPSREKLTAMQVLFEHTMHEARREWQLLPLRQRRLISLVTLVGLSTLLWWGIVGLLIR
jgi:hypothetical protein